MKRNKVSFARLVVDNQRRPATAWIEHGKSAELSKDPQERDENFFRLISQSCGNDTYSSIYMVGDGFDQEWAQRSTPYLCRNQRHVFYGNNLYVKGAATSQGKVRRGEPERLSLYQLFSGKKECEHGSGHRGFSEILSSGRGRGKLV